MTVPPIKGGEKHSQKLSEDVTQRQQIQEADGMNQTLILQIGKNSLLKRRNVGQHVAMGDDNTLRIGSRSGSKNDLENLITVHLARKAHLVRMTRQSLAEIFQIQPQRRKVRGKPA
jgi:hypothetical protein